MFGRQQTHPVEAAAAALGRWCELRWQAKHADTWAERMSCRSAAVRARRKAIKAGNVLVASGWYEEIG